MFFWAKNVKHAGGVQIQTNAKGLSFDLTAHRWRVIYFITKSNVTLLTEEAESHHVQFFLINYAEPNWFTNPDLVQPTPDI